MSQTECVIVCTTLPAAADAAAFGRGLVEARLAACVSSRPGACSVYRWQDGIEQDEEQQVTIKTTADRLAALERRINEVHPYDVPELLVLTVAGGSEPYLAWLRASTEVLDQS